MEYPPLGLPPKLKDLNTHAVHQVARFYAAAEATINGYRAEIEGTRTFITVNHALAQVFSRRAGGAWQVDRDPPLHEQAQFVIFVDLGSEPPNYYIAPADQMRTEIAIRLQEHKDRHGGQRPRAAESNHSEIKLEHVDQWRGRWDLFE